MRVLNIFFNSAVTQIATVDENTVLDFASSALTDCVVSSDQSLSCDAILAAAIPNQISDASLVFLRADTSKSGIGMEFAEGQKLYCTINSGAPSGFIQLIFSKPIAI